MNVDHDTMWQKGPQMKAIVAVGICGFRAVFRAVLVKTWPEAKGPDDPWGAEIEATGDSDVGSMGLELPDDDDDPTGMWVWEGSCTYFSPEEAPTWLGTWRRATTEDLASLLCERRGNS